MRLHRTISRLHLQLVLYSCVALPLGGGGVRLLGKEVNSATMNCRSFVSMYTSVTFHVTNQVEYSSGSLLSIIPNK